MTGPTTPDRTGYRLTKLDRAQCRHTIIEGLGRWDTNGVLPTVLDNDARGTLRRTAAYSIGCTLADLRESEVEWLDAEIERYWHA